MRTMPARPQAASERAAMRDARGVSQDDGEAGMRPGGSGDERARGLQADHVAQHDDALLVLLGVGQDVLGGW